MILKGDTAHFDKPLKVKQIGIDEYKCLLVFDRWSGLTPSAKISRTSRTRSRMACRKPTG
ncbi:MAG: hypothetical protein H0X25_19635 [Acidobacteriales bacterium]|nr:hypothetical protein [Terriglobales bacterium]